MKRDIFTLLLATGAGIGGICAFVACSSDESTGANGADASTSSSGGSSGVSSSGGSSGTSSSGSDVTDTCLTGGGACVCGGLMTACPNGGTRDATKTCKQGAQGSGACSTTCCVGGDAGGSSSGSNDAGNDGSNDAGNDADADAN